MSDPLTLFYAFLGGLLPALIWLFFFLREDRTHPEPKRLLFYAFLSGMLVVALALYLESEAARITENRVERIIWWSIIEEVLKWGAAYLVVLRRRAVDEPIDAMIYLITVALGFAAAETALFMSKPFLDGDILGGILTGNLRFMGAALLHTLASGIVGGAIALAFYRRRLIRVLYLCTGLFLAIILHALFNFFIMNVTEQHVVIVFFFVWIGIITLFLLFEKAKRITRRHQLTSH